ncbi:MAG TPA: hypothetical protein VGL13_05215 [Polyangiaceae bacterium]
MKSATADQLRALSRKYRTLGEWRRTRERDGGLAEPAALRALAREFPGALRELDTLPLDEIERRVEALERAAAAAATERWMEWMHGYHVTMRAALFVKARVARRASDEVDAIELAALASERSGIAVDESFVRAVAAPPAGRLNRAVFERLGAAFGVSPDEIWETLFPSRRPGRFVKRHSG